MLLGAHMSIAGGVTNAITAGQKLGCTAIQMFTKSSNQWHARTLGPDEIARFRELRQEAGMLVVAHDAYLINLASPDDDLLRRSKEAFLEEMERCEQLDIRYLVAHPGSHVGAGEERGLERIVESLNWLHSQAPDSKVTICLETTAGQGSGLGHRFEQIAYLIENASESDRLGVCMDTCHVFAAGYDIRDKKAYARTMKEFDRIIGLGRLKVVHMNDSKKDLGSQVDRHEHIGRGTIGKRAFGYLLNDARLRHLPFVLETPKDEKNRMDEVNLAMLRSLIVADS